MLLSFRRLTKRLPMFTVSKHHRNIYCLLSSFGESKSWSIEVSLIRKPRTISKDLIQHYCLKIPLPLERVIQSASFFSVHDPAERRTSVHENALAKRCESSQHSQPSSSSCRKSSFLHAIGRVPSMNRSCSSLVHRPVSTFGSFFPFLPIIRLHIVAASNW